MYSVNKVRNAIFNYVGWENTLDTNELALDPNVFTTPTSGIYYNNENSQLELGRLRYVAPFQEGWNYANYSASTTYNTGDIVKDPNDNSIFYESAVDSNTGNALTDTNFWTRRYPFSEWLEKKTKQFINKFLNKVVLEKKLTQTTKSLFVDNNLFFNTGNIKDTVSKQGRFVGYRIQVNRYKDLQMIIRRIGLQLTQPQALNIYVYHSSQLDPIQIINVNYTKTISSQWISFDNYPNVDPITLEHVDYDESTGTDAGGIFYIGYYEDDLTGSAIRYKYQAKQPCTSCNPQAARHYKNYSKHAIIQPFSVSSGNLEPSRQYWDSSNDVITTNQSWGLNLSFSEVCDISDFLIDNRAVMVNALLAAANTWGNEEILNSNRDNNPNNKYKEQAAYNLSPDGLNIKQMYQDEVEAIDFDFSNLNTPCAPKNQLKRRPRYGSI